MMTTSTIALFALPGLILLGNLVVSILVQQSRYYSPGQKFIQCGVVWLIPIIGSIAIWAFLRSQHGWEKFDTRAYPERSEKMVLPELDSSSHGGSSD